MINLDQDPLVMSGSNSDYIGVINRDEGTVGVGNDSSDCGVSSIAISTY